MSKKDSILNSNKRIRIPVYVSEMVESPSTDAFQSYDEMIARIENLIDNFNQKSEDDKFVLGRKYKCKVRTIRAIDTFKFKYGDVPVLLLRISEYKTGITDMFVETVEKKQVGSTDKVGSDYNCALLYPIINRRGLDYSNNWLIFVYNDPGKEDSEVITTVKAVLKVALNLKIQHVKSHKANEEIQRTGIIPQMAVQYVTITNKDNDRVELAGYRVSSKSVTTEYLEFEHIPAADVETFVNSPKDTNYFRRKIKVSLKNHKELKYDHIMDENYQTVKDAIEESFNFEKEISNEKIKEMYEPAFITNVIGEAVRAYLSNE